jgi:RNA polymerase sigma-70 factor, ECF subfamily
MLLPDLLLLFALSIRNDDEDRKLAALIREGDQAAFKRFFEKHQAPLLSFLMSKGMDKQSAEDMLQQAFLTIWDKRAELKANRSIRSFLFTIAYNRMLNHFRNQKKNEPEYAFELAGTGQNPAELAETSEAMQAMQAALEIMPEKRRMVFELCYLQEFTYHEAAEALNITRKTVENHMALALKDLRKALKLYEPP